MKTSSVIKCYEVCTYYAAGGHNEYFYNDLKSAECSFNKPMSYNGMIKLYEISSETIAGLMANYTRSTILLKERHESNHTI